METKRKPALQPQMTTQLVTSVAGRPVDVSVVIPCLNEANSIGICVEKAQKAFKDAGLRGEVVVTDNGSTDGSTQIAEKLGARVISAKRLRERPNGIWGLRLTLRRR